MRVHLQRKALHPPAKSLGGLFHDPLRVAESGEISNLELFDDIVKILEIIESVNSGY